MTPKTIQRPIRQLTIEQRDALLQHFSSSEVAAQIIDKLRGNNEAQRKEIIEGIEPGRAALERQIDPLLKRHSALQRKKQDLESDLTQVKMELQPLSQQVSYSSQAISSFAESFAPRLSELADPRILIVIAFVGCCEQVVQANIKYHFVTEKSWFSGESHRFEVSNAETIKRASDKLSTTRKQLRTMQTSIYDTSKLSDLFYGLVEECVAAVRSAGLSDNEIPERPELSLL